MTEPDQYTPTFGNPTVALDLSTLGVVNGAAFVDLDPPCTGVLVDADADRPLRIARQAWLMSSLGAGQRVFTRKVLLLDESGRRARALLIDIDGPNPGPVYEVWTKPFTSTRPFPLTTGAHP